MLAVLGRVRRGRSMSSPTTARSHAFALSRGAEQVRVQEGQPMGCHGGRRRLGIWRGRSVEPWERMRVTVGPVGEVGA